MALLVVGSIALDTVKTPVEEHGDLFGGSASYAATAASYFSPVKLVGIVGTDFPQTEFDFWKSRKIDTAGVQRVEGKTFRWSGEYAWDLNTRQTRSTELNVFEKFEPKLPRSYRKADFVLLANIAPALQSRVLKQMERPHFVVADTMNLWIETTRADLDTLLPNVDLLILNDSEAREMTKETEPCYSATMNFSAAARTHLKIFMIRPEQGTRLLAAWPGIWPARCGRSTSPIYAKQ